MTAKQDFAGLAGPVAEAEVICCWHVLRAGCGVRQLWCLLQETFLANWSMGKAGTCAGFAWDVE